MKSVKNRTYVIQLTPGPFVIQGLSTTVDQSCLCPGASIWHYNFSHPTLRGTWIWTHICHPPNRTWVTPNSGRQPVVRKTTEMDKIIKPVTSHHRTNKGQSSLFLTPALGNLLRNDSEFPRDQREISKHHF